MFIIIVHIRLSTLNSSLNQEQIDNFFTVLFSGFDLDNVSSSIKTDWNVIDILMLLQLCCVVSYAIGHISYWMVFYGLPSFSFYFQLLEKLKFNVTLIFFVNCIHES